METLLLAGGAALAVVLGLLVYILIRVIAIEMFTLDDDPDKK
jgi:hypothetical protein